MKWEVTIEKEKIPQVISIEILKNVYGAESAIVVIFSEHIVKFNTKLIIKYEEKTLFYGYITSSYYSWTVPILNTIDR